MASCFGTSRVVWQAVGRPASFAFRRPDDNVVCRVANAQTDGLWVPIGPFGGDVRSLVADPQQPDRMYLGTRTGQVYLSVDGGRSWNRLTGLDAPSYWIVDDLLIDPGNTKVLYAGMW